MVLRVAARAKVDARRLVRQAASKAVIGCPRPSRPSRPRGLRGRRSGGTTCGSLDPSLPSVSRSRFGLPTCRHRVTAATSSSQTGSRCRVMYRRSVQDVSSCLPENAKRTRTRSAKLGSSRWSKHSRGLAASPWIRGIACTSCSGAPSCPSWCSTRPASFLYGGGGDIFSRDSHFVQVDTEGNVRAVDRENQRIIKYNNALDRILMVLGTRGVPGCDAKHFNRPTDVARIEPTLALKAQ